MNEKRQLELLEEFASYYAELPESWSGSLREAGYRFANDYYSWADGIVLYCMLRYLQPKRFVEVGSGFSSALALETDELFLGNSVDFVFIDPYPQRFRSLYRNENDSRAPVIESRVQDVPPDVFAALGPGDVLLIDSSHVSKTGSDVNYLLFEILPRLRSGVYIHCHDVFYPFEYPEGWVRDGVAWNEAYLLHAFLQYNSAFSIQFFTSYLVQRHRGAFARALPLAMNSEVADPKISDAPGASLWLRSDG